MTRPVVHVLMGGPDAEREVSLDSGRAVADALRESGRYEVLETTIDRPTAEQLRDFPGDVIFPVLHGHWGEGGPLQSALAGIGRPYVGSSSIPCRVAMDKLLTKRLAEGSGIATPEAVELRPADPCPIDPPLVLKPIDDGSSVDLRICRSTREIEEARLYLHARRPRLMAERYIAGREVTVGILDDQALPLIEIRPAVEFYDYEAKYTRADTEYHFEPKDISSEIRAACREMAMTVYQRLGCRDLARADLMIDERGPWFLEINTMPGFTSHSLVPMAARKIGYDMPALCSKLVELALRRGPDEPILIHSISSGELA